MSRCSVEPPITNSRRFRFFPDDAAACAWVTRDEIEAGRYPTFPTLLPLLDLAMKSADCPGTRMPSQRRDGGGAAE